MPCRRSPSIAPARAAADRTPDPSPCAVGADIQRRLWCFINTLLLFRPNRHNSLPDNYAWSPAFGVCTAPTITWQPHQVRQPNTTQTVDDKEAKSRKNAADPPVREASVRDGSLPAPAVGGAGTLGLRTANTWRTTRRAGGDGPDVGARDASAGIRARERLVAAPSTAGQPHGNPADRGAELGISAQRIRRSGLGARRDSRTSVEIGDCP